MSFAISRPNRKYAVVLLGVLVVVILALVFFGRRGYDERLLRCDSLVNSDPAAGAEMFFALVDSGYTPSCSGDRALCALVEAKSCIKNRLEYNGDSLLAVAAEYFNRQNDRIHFAESKLYLGRSHYNSSRYRAALLCGLTAVDAAKSIPDSLTTARAYDLIADVYSSLYNHGNELVLRKKASDLYKTIHPFSYQCSVIEVAGAMFKNGLYDDAIQRLDSLFKEVDVDSSLMGSVYAAYAFPYFYRGDIAEAKRLLMRQIDLEGADALIPDQREILVEIYLNEEKLDSAELWIPENVVGTEDSLVVLSMKSSLYKHKKDYQQALDAYENVFRLENGIMNSMLKNEAVNANADYYSEVSKNNALRAKEANLRAIIIGLTGLILIVLIPGILIFYARKKSMEKEALIGALQNEMNALERIAVEKEREAEKIFEIHKTEALEVEKELEQSKNEIERLNSLSHRMFSEHFSVLNRLCREYYSKRDSQKMRLLIIKDIEAEIESMKSDESKAKLISLLNDSKDGIMDKLKSDFPTLKSGDFDFLMWVFAGFSSHAICIFCSITPTNFYSKRRRLRERIEQSQSINRQLFMLAFDRS